LTTLPELITSCRLIAGDGEVSNLARNENLKNAELGNDVNGVNTVFSVLNVPIAPGGIQMVRVDNTYVNIDTVTPNEALGMFTLAVAPQTSVYAMYYYYLFPDAVWTEFVTSALQRLNLSSGNPTLDVQNVPEGLLGALKIYAQAFFDTSVAQQTGLWYDQKLGERAESRDDVAKKYTTLAEKNFKQGDVARDAFYNDRILVPNLVIQQHQASPWTPRA
jgi:hypothetical protein